MKPVAAWAVPSPYRVQVRARALPPGTALGRGRGPQLGLPAQPFLLAAWDHLGAGS